MNPRCGQCKGCRGGVALFLGYALLILAGVGLSLGFVVDQAVNVPVTPPRPGGDGPPRLHDLHDHRGHPAQGRGAESSALGLATLAVPAIPARAPPPTRASPRSFVAALALLLFRGPAGAGGDPRGSTSRDLADFLADLPPPTRHPLTTPPRRPSPAARATRRSRRPTGRSTTFLERNRTRLLWAGGIIVFLVLAFVGLNRALDHPPPTSARIPSIRAPRHRGRPPPAAPLASGATPAPARPRPPAPGFVQPDMGHNHVDVSTRVEVPVVPAGQWPALLLDRSGPDRGRLLRTGRQDDPGGAGSTTSSTAPSCCSTSARAMAAPMPASPRCSPCSARWPKQPGLQHAARVADAP